MWTTLTSGFAFSHIQHARDLENRPFQIAQPAYPTPDPHRGPSTGPLIPHSLSPRHPTSEESLSPIGAVVEPLKNQSQDRHPLPTAQPTPRGKLSPLPQPHRARGPKPARTVRAPIPHPSRTLASHPHAPPPGIPPPALPVPHARVVERPRRGPLPPDGYGFTPVPPASRPSPSSTLPPLAISFPSTTTGSSTPATTPPSPPTPRCPPDRTAIHLTRPALPYIDQTPQHRFRQRFFQTAYTACMRGSVNSFTQASRSTGPSTTQ